MIQFPLHIRIQQRRIAFAPTPENIALSTEFVSHFERFFDLRRRVGEDIGVAACSRAVNKARVDEQAGSSPKQFDTSSLLLLLEHLDYRVEITIRLLECSAFGSD